jgi:CRISPR-associated protein (Cas_Csd1)
MSQNRGYLLGRLFALLASQGVLEQTPEQLYELASTAPPQVLPKALAILIGSGKEQILFPLMKQLPLEAFDGPLNRREQGAFAIGYAHERSGYAVPQAEDEGDEEGQDLTERYEFRVDPQLKEWIKMSGGGAFIRSLLRAERTKSAQDLAPKQSLLSEEENTR